MVEGVEWLEVAAALWVSGGVMFFGIIVALWLMADGNDDDWMGWA